MKPENRSFSKDKALAARAGTKGGKNTPAEKRAFALDKALAVKAAKKARERQDG